MISPNLDPLSLDLNAPSSAIVREGETNDARENVDTQYSMSVGDTFRGEISSTTDEDWVAIYLTGGETYDITLNGLTLSDPYLTVLDSRGNFVAYDDDGGPSLDSALTFTAPTSGTYYIEADAYSSQTGTYELAVSLGTPPVPRGSVATFEQLADFLQDGGGEGVNVWDTSSSNVITVDITGLTAAGRQLAIWAMEAWEMVADIDFAVRGGGRNEFSGEEMITADDENFGAYAYFPNSGGIPDGVELNVGRDWLNEYGTTIDSYSFQTYVHEFGHALGLYHQGDYDASSGVFSYENSATFANDSWQVSIMSYFSQTENPTVNASFAGLVGPMIADIIAIQDFYGAPGASGATAGNTTFGLNSNLGNYLDEVFMALATGRPTANVSGDPIAYTVYDQGGIDTIDMSFLGRDTGTRITLADGTFSDIGDSIGVLAIAVGTTIENLYTGAGDDTLSGNGANNTLRSGLGNDLVFGNAGSDTIYGENGSDGIFGGGQNDNLYGGAGNDALGGGGGNDVIDGGIGNDTIWGSSGNDTVYGSDGADQIGAGRNNDVVYGGSGADQVYGGGGRDYVSGGTEDDVVGGSFGADTLYGNGGNDTIWGQVGTDTLFGGGGNDIMAGGSGSDRLSGGAGRDEINGSFGNDILTGDAGADAFIFDSRGNDRITDFSLAENDMVYFDLAALGVTSRAGSLDGEDIVSDYAQVRNGTVVFDVNGSVVTLEGVNTLNGLADHVGTTWDLTA